MEPYGFIYVTTNNINNRKYIGKKKYDERGVWRRYLGSGIGIRHAIEKHGAENFSREIIDVAYSVDELNDKERYWISAYNAVNDDNFYNIAAGGDGGNVRVGYSQDEYERSEARRIASINKSRVHGEDASWAKLTKKDVFDVIQMFKDGIHTGDIAEKYDVSYSTILDIRKHRTWKELTNGIEFPDIPPEVQSQRRSARSKNKKPVDVFSKEMDYVATYASAREAERNTGVPFRLISQVCNGEKRQSHGLIFRFASTSGSSTNDNITQ